MLTPVEVEAVVRATTSEWEAALLTTAAFTGLRMGELRALRWQDVDFDKRLVHVRRGYVHGVFDVPKSRKVRSVPMVDQVAAALDGLSRRERFTRPDDLVFGNELGEPFDDGGARQAF